MNTSLSYKLSVFYYFFTLNSKTSKIFLFLSFPGEILDAIAILSAYLMAECHNQANALLQYKSPKLLLCVLHWTLSSYYMPLSLLEARLDPRTVDVACPNVRRTKPDYCLFIWMDI